MLVCAPVVPSAFTETAFWEIACAGGPVTGSFTGVPVLEGFAAVTVVTLAVAAAGWKEKLTLFNQRLTWQTYCILLAYKVAPSLHATI